MSDELAKVIKLFREDPQAAQAEEAELQLTQMQKVYSLWEAMFVKHGQTLTDPAAADSLRAAIAMMGVILDGACATGMINEAQRDDLRAAVNVGLSAADDLQGLS